MLAKIIVIGGIIAGIVGYMLNSSYKDKYGEPAIIILPFIAQTLLLLCMFFTWYGHNYVWFFIWVFIMSLSYIWGIIMCKNHASSQGATPGDLNKALIAQCLLPLGGALLIIIIIGVIYELFSNKRRRKYYH